MYRNFEKSSYKLPEAKLVLFRNHGMIETDNFGQKDTEETFIEMIWNYWNMFWHSDTEINSLKQILLDVNV